MRRLIGLTFLPLLGGCAWLGIDYSSPTPPEPPPPPDLKLFTRLPGELTLPTGKVTYDCGPEALTCVLRSFGKEVSVDEITARIYNPNEQATISTQMAPTARMFGLAANLIEGSVGLIKQSIDRGEPPIIMVRVNDDLHHFFVVTGYSDTKQMILCEEYDGLKRAIEYRELTDMWQPVAFFMLQIAPSTAETEFAEGARLEEQGRYDEAIERYHKALSMDPMHQPSLVGLGNCELAKGEYDRAVEFYRRALSLYEDDPKALNNLAHTLWAQGTRLDEAKRHSDRSVTIYSDRLNTLENIRKTREGLGASEGSIGEIRRRINETRIELALSYGTLAAIRYALREYMLAISAWKASFDLLDMSYTDLRARRLLMIARAFKELNVRSQWQSHLEQALELAQDTTLREEIRIERLGQTPDR